MEIPATRLQMLHIHRFLFSFSVNDPKTTTTTTTRKRQCFEAVPQSCSFVVKNYNNMWFILSHLIIYIWLSPWHKNNGSIAFHWVNLHLLFLETYQEYLMTARLLRQNLMLYCRRCVLFLYIVEGTFSWTLLQSYKTWALFFKTNQGTIYHLTAWVCSLKYVHLAFTVIQIFKYTPHLLFFFFWILFWMWVFLL